MEGTVFIFYCFSLTKYKCFIFVKGSSLVHTLKINRTGTEQYLIWSPVDFNVFTVNAARKSKVDDNTARMQSIKQLGV